MDCVSMEEKRDKSMATGEQVVLAPLRAAQEQLWMVPHTRNSYFTGRETELQEITTALHAAQNGALGLAISGPGGVGKTQLALEYAYRHREDYRHVFWVLASTRDILHAAYGDIAALLNLPEKREPDYSLLVGSVRHWLAQNDAWLLI